ncbi:valine--tRNA ligase [Myxacorys almedinensis]|uniref:Valine--tRNA ligase n=1 Tax=Myxacorys almedinensis A TaxID=2690445 RepID=A0A8J7YYG0_9CYAN|nr:valine--tRNA ligase [Myxacorys almedinensis]NDJ16932.1 valine--tRNA ligase [Myxacorys almedinensis A]
MTATLPTLSSQYDPTTTESKWQKFWEDKQVFKADPNKPGDPYCIVIPPPNVTGSLHMGHAFESSLIDVLVRYHRMVGDNTLWLPGTDHASIGVSTILEKQLNAEGKTRFELGRDAYLERAWQWKAESGGTISNQLRRLGVSVDWSRERFTMDEGLSNAVLEAFNKLYTEGLIYRGKYLVNWCPASQSAVSDLEVENQEVDGHLWHFRYPLAQGNEFVEVATTRPETMLGDTAVAVNPNDDRYKHLIGQTLILPLMQREIPIIADEAVDPSFGTGCVKVTPAHDPNDFEMGMRHHLDFISIMNKDGSLNEKAGEFEGQDRFVARKNVVKKMEEEGFLVKIEGYRHTVPYSDRGKVPIEPLISTQWFVKIAPLSSRALSALDDQSAPQFVPDRWAKVYRDWLVNLKDWCISRQLWWGHQIPAWYAVSETQGEITDTTPFVVARSEAEARKGAIAMFGEGVQLQQDPDVLDTWFSSGLWPFSTLGWSDETAADFQRYYPTATLVTGFDIIFFWVARMTLMAGHFTGQMPFKDVYIHGLVRDENNKKMSKSSNNGIDPLILIDKYGTDALRYTLVREVTGAGQDIRLAYDRKTDESESVEAARNFTNKIWNASRFVLMNLDGKSPKQLGDPDADKLELSDRWILSRFHQVTRDIRGAIDQYGLGEAAKLLYEFFWGDLCDWYIELAKSRLQGNNPTSRLTAQQTLAHVLEGTLKLMHPFMPHITEEIWHTLTQTSEASGDSLAVQPFPSPNAALIDANLEQQFGLIIDTIRTIRNLRAEADIKPGVKIVANLQTESDRERQILAAGQSYIQSLAKVEHLTISAQTDAPTFSANPSTKATPLEDAKSVLGTALDATGNFLAKHQKPILSVGLIVFILIALKVFASVLTAVHEIPLLAPVLEIIGIGYSGWFSYHRLLRTRDRQRLYGQIQQFTVEVIGEAHTLEVTPVLGQEGSHAPEEQRSPTQTQPANSQTNSQTIVGVVGTVQVAIPLAGLVDLDALRAKTEKDLKKLDAEIQALGGRLSNPKFVDKAPAEVVQSARNALAEAETQAEILRSKLGRL